MFCTVAEREHLIFFKSRNLEIVGSISLAYFVTSYIQFKFNSIQNLFIAHKKSYQQYLMK